MLMPKRIKHRKVHRGRMKGRAGRGNTLAFGEYGLQALEPCWLTSRQIEAARRVMVRFVRRGGMVWIRVFPHKPVSHRPAETRMGGGRGELDHWVAVVKPGLVLFEMGGVPEAEAREALHMAAYKLPIRTQVVGRESVGEAK